MYIQKQTINDLYATYTTVNAARGLVATIGPIYLYRLGFSINNIIVFFIITAVFKVAGYPGGWAGITVISSFGSSLIASAYGGRFYKNIDTARRMEYLFATEMANSLPWLLYFPLLLIVSHNFSLLSTLKIGIVLIAPATLGMNLIGKKSDVKYPTA
jgi:hypothetical protein